MICFLTIIIIVCSSSNNAYGYSIDSNHNSYLGEVRHQKGERRYNPDYTEVYKHEDEEFQRELKSYEKGRKAPMIEGFNGEVAIQSNHNKYNSNTNKKALKKQTISNLDDEMTNMFKDYKNEISGKGKCILNYLYSFEYK